MLVIGVESSAHTFGVGIVKNGKVLANVKNMYKIGNKGLIPSKVAETHVKNASLTVRQALATAGIGLEDIEGVGYTRGPGMGPCLQVGELTAKTLARKLNVKITQVNHAVGHVEVTRGLTGLKDPLTLYVSGGNSQILKLTREPFKHYAILGETFDIGVGNMLDSFARELKLVPSWGSSVARLAREGRYVSLPYTVKGMDFSFTGLLTSATKLIGVHKKEDLCYSIQEVAYSMLCEATERALLLTNSKEVAVCGGVAQSARLREMLKEMAREHHVKFGCAPDEYNADNGAMIAWVAECMLKKGISSRLEDCGVEQRYRIDRAEVA
jgi:glycoprotease/Kae1 family metallohydrolase